MRTTTRITNYKNFKKELEIINFINSFQNTDSKIYINNFMANTSISKMGKNLKIKIKNRILSDITENKKTNNVFIKINENEFVIESLSIKNSELSDSSKFDVNIFRTKKFNIKSSFKCIIPIPLSKLNSFHFQFETITYQNEITEYFYDCIRLDLNNFKFDITQIKTTESGFYIIQCDNIITFKKFKDYCFSIRQALGFITGYMPGGEEFYIDNNLNFKFINNQRPQIDSLYKPINTNPYSFLHLKKEKRIADFYNNKLTILPSKKFSNLVLKINTSEEFSAIILLMLEASSVRSFLLIPSMFAVVVEGLSKIINIEEPQKKYPIEDNEISKKLNEKLIQVVDNFKQNINDWGIIKIKRRINEINQPEMPKNLKNNEKLIYPFDLLGITLSIDEIKIIEHRNDLLHGKILLSNSNCKSINDSNNYMGYVSGKLYTLISALILKYISYNGYIINHSKFYEDSVKIKSSDDFYKYI